MKKYPVLIVIFVLIFAMLACTINVGGPDAPQRAIPVSTDAVATLDAQVKQAAEVAVQTGEMTLFINEEQLTSLLASRLEDNPDAFIQNPQVYLDDGQIQIYGKAHQGMLEATVGIVVTASVDANGLPLITVTSADFGPIPVPDGLKESIASLVQEAYTGSLGPVATGFRLTAIIVDNGLMMLTGKTK